MRPRERVEAVLNFSEPDRIPVIPPFQGFWALVASGLKVTEAFATPMKGAEAQLWMLEKTPFDALEVIWDWLTPVEACGCKVVIPEASNPATMEPVVRSLDEVGKLEVPDISKHARSVNDFKIATFLNGKLSKDRFTYITLTCPFTLAAELRGVENMMLDILKKPDMLKPLIEYSSQVLQEYLRWASDTGVDGMFWCDPSASAGLISPKQFRTFAMPYGKTILQKTKETDMKALLHICGNTSDRLDALLEMSPDLMSLDYHVKLADAAKVLGGHVPFMGNVDTTDLFMKKPEDVRAAAKACLRSVTGRGFALGAACDVPIGSPIENVVALCNAVIK
jgi:MtaA/CmuA family methyltransferase